MSNLYSGKIFYAGLTSKEMKVKGDETECFRKNLFNEGDWGICTYLARILEVTKDFLVVGSLSIPGRLYWLGQKFFFLTLENKNTPIRHF